MNLQYVEEIFSGVGGRELGMTVVRVRYRGRCLRWYHSLSAVPQLILSRRQCMFGCLGAWERAE